MFNGNPKNKDISLNADDATPSGEPRRKYFTPKHKTPWIALFDLPPSVGETLSKFGLNVAVGSFGKPYETRKRRGNEQVRQNSSMPSNLREQDIIISPYAVRIW